VTSQFPHLFSSLTMRGGVELPNRIVSTAHSTGLSRTGRIGAAVTAYHEARAAGGVGLIIVGTTSVHPTSTSRHQTALTSWDDSVIPDYKRLASALHPYGTRVFVQLNHAGGLSGSADGVRAVVAPSPIDTELGVDTPHELSVGEINEIIAAFALAAERVRAGGLDGVEIHAGHGNLVQQFLSPLTNCRDDEYGGNRQRRMAFALEVVRVVRAAVGDDFPVGIRISVEEDLPGGLDVDDACWCVPRLVRAADLDYVNVTTGSDTSAVSLPHHYAPMYVPSQHMRPLARAITEVVDVPVLCVGRITDPRDAEDILASGDAHLIGMTRALIADARLPEKAAAGHLDRIRYCVGINDGCLGRLFRGLPISCVQDPSSGRELELGALPTVASPRRVIVVGGGPAGLEAARVAAERGHEVILLEAASEVGGQVALARRPPGRAEVGVITDQIVADLLLLDVEIRCGVTADVELVLGLKPDSVVVATGSDPRVPNLDDGNNRLVSTRDVYRPAVIVGDPLVLFDTRGEVEGLATADWLAGRGFSVTVVTSGSVPGWRIETITRTLIHQRLVDQGVPIRTTERVDAITADGVVVRHLMSGREETLEGIATVVSACGSRARDRLYRELLESRPTLDVHLVGDALAPRSIESAIYDGHMTGRAV